MPLVDLHCVLGTTGETRATGATDSQATARAAAAYADRFDVHLLCFSSAQASSDRDGGLADLLELLALDTRFLAWLTLGIHTPHYAADLARNYLVKPEFCGALIEQSSDADAIASQGGREVLNALRRYSKPVLLTVSSPATLDAAVRAAHEFSTLRFFISPQSEYMTRVTVAAISEQVNTLFLPVATYAERDIIAEAVETLGERRVVWGSNWGQFHPAAALGTIRDSAVTSAQRERIGWRNASDVLSV